MHPSQPSSSSGEFGQNLLPFSYGMQMSLGSPPENQSMSPRMGLSTNVLTIASAPSMIIASIWMAMIENTSPLSQRSTGSFKLAIQAGLSNMKI